MMKYMKYVVYLILILLIPHHSFGYFYYLCVMKKENPIDNKGQYIILLADYHDKNHNANKEQRDYFESLLTRYKDKYIQLIVEDLSSVNNDGRMFCSKYGINCCQGVLGHLANKARSLGILVDNVEYRYCRVASIGPLINNIKTNPHVFKSCVSISVLSLYQEIINEIEKIKKYDDGKKLNNFYKKTILNVRQQLCQLDLSNEIAERTVAQYCKELPQNKYRRELEKLCIFDSGLIDINILHAIAQSDASIIFVLAGGSHIEQVNYLLKKMRYQKIFATSLNNTFCPIDIAIIEKYID